jgi:hypothetical protein
MSARFTRLLVAVLSLGLVLTLGSVASASAGSNTATRPAAAKPKSSTALFYVTLYGFVDNSPPSAIISNPVIHSKAGGTGTFSDPVTFATDTREEKPGTIVYYSYLKKYFIMEDTCTECTKDWNGSNGDNPTPKRNGHYWRIDLWAGGNSSDLHNPGKQALLDCEDNLTQDKGGEVTLNPASNLPVDTTPIFNTSTNKCYTP